MLRAIDKWLFGYIRSVFRRPVNRGGMRHLMFCVADHFEPFRDGASKERALALVREWNEKYPDTVAGYKDADGRGPRHTFFYPQEEYDPECIDLLAGLCKEGHGEVEVHLHHENDTPEGFREKLEAFRDVLHERHGLLGRAVTPQVHRAFGSEDSNQLSVTGKQLENLQSAGSPLITDHCPLTNSSPSFAFIHGDWALCNSMPDGSHCGVNNELAILAEVGCYADFTFPSAPSPTQPRMVNAIYRAHDVPGRPRSHDNGEMAKGQEVRGKREEAVTPPQADAPVAHSNQWTVDGKAGKGTGESFRQNEQNLQNGNVLTDGGQRTETRNSKLETGGEANHINPVRKLFSNFRFQSSPSVSPFQVSGFRFQPSPLMLIQGPLALNWKRRKWGIFPRLENAEISGANPPTAGRIDLWVKQGIHVIGRPEWSFVKVHTHGCVEKNMDVWLGGSGDRGQGTGGRGEVLHTELTENAEWDGEETGVSNPCDLSQTPPLRGCSSVKDPATAWVVKNTSSPLPLTSSSLHRHLVERYNDGEKWCLHYVTAREMYNIVRAAEDGMTGNPGDYRDYEIEKPTYAEGKERDN